MANLKTLSGFPIQNLTSDPVPYAQALANNPYAGVWGSGANMNVTDKTQGRGSAGSTHSASLAFGGGPGSTGATESYNGTAWTELNDLNNARAYVVGMGTNTAALAVGGNPPATAGYTEVWNGSSWTETADLTRGPSSPQAAAYMMGSGSSTSGLVYGGDEGATNKSALTESWNGSAWTEVNDLNTSRSYGAGTGTSNTAALCLSGYNWTPGIAGSPLVEQWNGSSWTEIADVNGRGRAGASCQGSVTATIMFGGSPDNSTVLGNTESWDGSAWTEVNNLSTARNALGGSGVSTNALAFGGLTPPVTAVTEEWTFSGLPPSTPAAGYSDAIVGQMYYNSTSGQFKAIKNGGAPIGTWASSDSINTARTNAGSSGQAPFNSCVIFGGSEPPHSTKTESYNGSAWTELNDLNTARNDGGSSGVLTTAGFFGGTSSVGPDSALHEIWNGSSWTETTDLNTGRQALPGFGGSSTSSVAAGGSNPGVQALTEYWNGSSWTEVNNLNTAREAGSAAGIFTAGILSSGTTGSVTAAAETWNGSSWTTVASLNAGRTNAKTSGNSSLAVTFGGSSPSYTGATESWDGSSWTEVADLGTARGYLARGIGSATAAFAVTGLNPGGRTAITEKFEAGDFDITTLTTS